jgi:DNA-binding CsgD family transcriptional regulator
MVTVEDIKMLSTNNNDYDHIGREKQVIELYEQGKNTRDIAKELRMSLRDISIILRNNQVKHGIVIMGDGNDSTKKSPNEKATQAYKLFDEGKKPVEVAVQLSLSEKEVTRYYTEYWRLKGLYELHSIYKEIKDDLFLILKLYRLLKREGIRTKDLEWFVHTVNTGMYKIPEIQKQYVKVKDELEAIDYKKTIAKYQLDDMNNQITYLNKISYNKRNEIAYLKIGVQEVEGYVRGLKNHNQQQHKIQNE